MDQYIESIHINKTYIENMKKLYLISTKGLGDFYVIADNPAYAQNELEDSLVGADYGVKEDQKIENIKILAQEIAIDDEKERAFWNGNKLMIVNT